MPDSRFNEDQILKAALGRTNQCLSVETIAAVADGALDEAADRQARQHMEACAHCRTEFELFQEFQNASASPEEAGSLQWIESELRRRPVGAVAPSPAPQKGLAAKLNRWLHDAAVGHRRRVWALAGLCLLIVVAGGVYLREGRLQPLSGDGQMVWRSPQFTAISPAGDLAGAPIELRWEAVPDATKYRVRLLEVDRTEIWSADVLDTHVTIPQDLRLKMTSGRTFLWNVVASNAAGERIASTNLQTFHIASTSR